MGYTDDGDILCHPILVPTYLQQFDVANAKVGAERNPQKTEVIYYVNDLDAAPLEWRIRDVQNMAKVTTATAGSITLGVASLSDRDSTSRISSWPMRMSFEQCTNAFSCARTRRQNFFSNGKVWELASPTTILRVHGHTILQEKRAAEITQATLSEGPSGIEYESA